MKQVLQNPRTGSLELVEVPAPAVGPGQVLVRNAFSVVSPGTEKMALEFARKSLLGKARSRPDLVSQVVRKLRQEGPLPTYRAVMNRLDAPQPLGYSSAGTVDAVGSGVSRFAIGDRVACAGAGYASHAELVVVPENLVARVPDGVGLDDAAFATLGAIALQGVRVAAPTLGEVAAVIGLGPIGQLAVQLLRANGCRVLAVDLDATRVKQALDQGAEWGANPSENLDPWKVAATDGYGADLALVTASAESAAPLQLAAELSRQKGRISLVGAVPIEIERRTLYEKELELRMSTSYGPGRYDRTYEETGLDYPLPYVRWTENRNLQAFLALLATGSVRPDRLAPEVVPFDDAARVYEELAKGTRQSLVAVFRYPDSVSRDRTLSLAGPTAVHRSSPQRGVKDSVGVAFLGAGNYAKAVLLPLLAREKHARLVALVTATGASAQHTAKKFGFRNHGTDPEAVFSDPDVDLVFIATRHDSHADLAERALRAGKAVWLEKPVGLTPEQVDRVLSTARETEGFLTVGYNRRFSPHAHAARRALAGRRGPMTIHYAVNAGPPPRATWVTDPAIGGGRLVGEVCHFVDLSVYLTGRLPTSIFSRTVNEDPAQDDTSLLLISFPDKSIATIEYLANSDPSLPKERFSASADGHTVICENFRRTRLPSGHHIRTRNQDKGQAQAVATTFRALNGRASPISLSEIEAVSAVTFAALQSASAHHLVPLS